MIEYFLKGNKYSQCDTRKSNRHNDGFMPFGKYKGKLISSIEDLNYLKWVSEKMNPGYILFCINNQILKLQNLIEK